MNFRLGCLALTTAMLVPAICGAYDMRSGVVQKVTVNSPTMSNRDVMVEIQGVSQMCVGVNGESGYFNKSDTPDTFAAFVSTLLLAQSTGHAVIVFVTQGVEGCRIDHVQLSS